MKGKRGDRRRGYEAPRGEAQKRDAKKEVKRAYGEKQGPDKARRAEANEPSYYGAAARRRAQTGKGKASARSDKR